MLAKTRKGSTFSKEVKKSFENVKQSVLQQSLKLLKQSVQCHQQTNSEL